MKFMHFTASCSYTALAELLELEGLDTEDDQIALDVEQLRKLQADLMAFLRTDRSGTLGETLSTSTLRSLAKEYERILVKKLA